MRIYQLFNALMEKFVPMDNSEREELRLEAVKLYGTLKEEAIGIQQSNKRTLEENTAFMQDKEKYPDFVPSPLLKFQLKHQVILMLDQWWVRYIIASLYIYAVPKIKSFLAGQNGDDNDDDDEDSDKSDLELLMELKRLKKQQKYGL